MPDGQPDAAFIMALFTLLRPFTLHCTRKGSVAEGEGAQQTTRRGSAGPGVTGQDPRGTTMSRDSLQELARRLAQELTRLFRPPGEKGSLVP